MVGGSVVQSPLGQSVSDDALSWRIKRGGERPRWVILNLPLSSQQHTTNQHTEFVRLFSSSPEFLMRFWGKDSRVWWIYPASVQKCVAISSQNQSHLQASLASSNLVKLQQTLVKQTKRYGGNNRLISHQAEEEALGSVSRWQEEAGEPALCICIHTDEWKAVSLWNVGGGCSWHPGTSHNRLSAVTAWSP